MRIYLVQHAKAIAAELDPTRPLSQEGQREMEQMAFWFKKQDLDLSAIWHSPLLRAKQSAEIVAYILKDATLLKEVNELRPNEPVQALALQLAKLREPVMLIGHIPFLASLCGLFLTGNEGLQPLAFYNSGIICLEKKDITWQVLWSIPPGLLG